MPDLAPNPLQLGDLAYFDSFSGLIPVKIVAAGTVKGDQYLTFRTTAARPGWRRGEGFCVWSTTGHRWSLVPRQSVRTVRGQYRIRNNWHWLIDGRRYDIFG